MEASAEGCSLCHGEHAQLQKELQEQDEFIFELQQNEEVLEKKLHDTEKELRKWKVQAEDLAAALAEREQEQDDHLELRNIVADLMPAIEKYKIEINEKKRELEVALSTQMDLSTINQKLETDLQRLRSSFAIVQDENEKEKKRTRKMHKALELNEKEIQKFELAVSALRHECDVASARADQVEGEMVVVMKEMEKVKNEKDWVQDAVSIQARKHRVEREGLEKDKATAVSELEGFVAELEMELQKEADESGVSVLEEKIRHLQLDMETEREARVRDQKMVGEHKQKMLQAVQENKGLCAKVEGLIAALELEREKRVKVEQILAATSMQADKASRKMPAKKRSNSTTQSRKVGLKKNNGPEVDVSECSLPGSSIDPLDSSTDLESSYECRSPTEHMFHASPFFCDDEKAVADMLSLSKKGRTHIHQKESRRGRSHSHSPPSPSKASTAVRRLDASLDLGIFDVATKDCRNEDDYSLSVSQSVSFPLSRTRTSTLQDDNKRSWKSSMAKKKRVLILPETRQSLPHTETLRSRTPELQSATS